MSKYEDFLANEGHKHTRKKRIITYALKEIYLVSSIIIFSHQIEAMIQILT